MFKNNLMIAFRNLLRYKMYSLINILGLAIGMACTILILLWVRDEVSYDKYHKNIDEIYRIGNETNITGQHTKTAITAAPVAPALRDDFPEVKNAVRIAPYIQKMSIQKILVKHEDKRFYESRFYYADSTIFDVFTFPLIMGNPRTALKESYSMVITEEMAHKYFGNENPVGKVLNIDNKFDFKVTGVLKNIPHNSHLKFDLLGSFSTLNNIYADDRDVLENWMYLGYYTYIQLAKGYPASGLEKKLPAFIEKYAGNIMKATGFKMEFSLQPLKSIHLHSHLFGEFQSNSDIKYVYIFTAIAFFVLLIACINCMNLSTARASTRTKEVGVRKVIGSTRFQLIKQFLGESILFSAIASVAAIGIVEFLLPAFNSLTEKKLAYDFYNEWGIFFGLILFTVLVGVISGSYPAFYLSLFSPGTVLKRNKAIGSKSTLIRKWLVITQFVISIVLIIGTVVINNQMAFIRDKKLGFHKEHMVILPIRNEAIARNYESIKNELLQNPNILNVSASSGIPTGGLIKQLYLPGGSEMNEGKFFQTFMVDHDFVETYGLEIVDGRDFSKNFSTDETKAFILNETAAKKLGWDSPVGKKLTWLHYKMKAGIVIGITKDFHTSSLHNPVEPLVIHIDPDFFNYFTVRIRPDNIPKTLGFLDDKWRQFAPGHPFDYFFLDDDFDLQYKMDERVQEIFLYFASLTIFLACLGLFGLSSFAAEHRTKEIGIRKVMGASIPNIVMLLSKDFVKLVLLANIIAWPIAYLAMNKWLENFVYQVNIGLGTLVLSAALALAIALFTMSFQTVKVALTNPANTLRYE